ncbi:MAG: hypothetical protein IPL61_37945 [Myxococcales bacterium]|nr:hypothetical protein [Myxococcales bacterium]
MPNDFTAIDPDALETVTGGRRSSTSGSSTDDRLFDALSDIKSALSDLGKNQAQPSSSGLDQLMPILMMQMMNRGTGPGTGGGNGCGGGCR